MLKDAVFKYSIGKMILCITLIIFLKINRAVKKGWLRIVALGHLVPYSFEILLCLAEFHVKEGRDKVSFGEIRERIEGNRSKFSHRYKTLKKNELISILNLDESTESLYSITSKSFELIKIFAQKYPFLYDFRDLVATKFDIIKHSKILQKSNVIISSSAKIKSIYKRILINFCFYQRLEIMDKKVSKRNIFFIF